MSVRARAGLTFANARRLPRRCAQVHDELLYEVPHHLADDMRKILKSRMQNAFSGEMRVKMLVKVKQGRSWGEMKEVDA